MHPCTLGEVGAGDDIAETSYIQPDNLKCSLGDAPSENLQIPVQTGCPGWLSATNNTQNCGSRAWGSWET